MKLRYILIAFLLVGCGSDSQAPQLTKTDSLLIKSDSAIASVNTSSGVLDSVTEVTTEKVNDHIKVLTNTITNYETQIKSAVKVKTVEKIIHDTVYIEVKKSFWGKTKTSVTKKSDSTLNQSEIVDTTNNN